MATADCPGAKAAVQKVSDGRGIQGVKEAGCRGAGTGDQAGGRHRHQVARGRRAGGIRGRTRDRQCGGAGIGGQGTKGQGG